MATVLLHHVLGRLRTTAEMISSIHGSVIAGGKLALNSKLRCQFTP